MPGQLYPLPYGAFSPAYLPAYQAPVIMPKAYAEIWSGINPANLEDENTLLYGPLQVTAGAVTIDRSNVIRRTATNVTMLPDVGGYLLPIAGEAATDDTGLFSPEGHELRLYKGILEDESYTEYAKLGVFFISEVDVVNDSNGVTLVGTLKDRGQWLSRNTFSVPYVTNGTSEVGQVILDILLQPLLPYVILPFPVMSGFATISPYVPTVSSYKIGDDPWQAAQDQAAAAGLELFFDYDGVLTIQAVPDPNSIDPCVTYLEGTTTAPVTISRALNNDDVPNIVCVVSQGSGVTAPVAVYWWEDDPESAMYYAPTPAGGFTTPQYVLPLIDAAATYPPLLQRFESTLIGPTFQADQAQAVALAIGLTSKGSLEKTTFTIRDQPAHDIDDVIYTQRVVAGIPEATDTYYILDQVVIDLTPLKPVQITGRLVNSA
jgi:hypothetical protein